MREAKEAQLLTETLFLDDLAKLKIVTNFSLIKSYIICNKNPYKEVIVKTLTWEDI